MRERATAARAVFFVASIVFSCSLAPAGAATIQRVAVAPASANPSAGDAISLVVTLRRAARLDVQVVDRDGFVVRTLPPKSGAAGANALVWDGRDGSGAVVPDEAYSFRVVAAGGADEYFPAAHTAGMVVVDPLSYSRTTATLAYSLKTPSRVHVQAGTADSAGAGPVLKTIADRQPRASGTIAEHWNGFDESASFYLPDLPGFVVAIAATPLPENSVITFGNAKRPFLDYAAHRAGRSLFPSRGHGAHHAGLDAFNDLAPRLTVTATAAASLLHLQMRADGPTAAAFLRQPGKVFVFVDSKLTATVDAREAAAPLDVPLQSDGEHVVAVNWRSDYGPVAVAVTKAVRSQP